MNDKKIHPIRHVAQRTRLTPHVIRAWERRYRAVTPARSPSNRRLYSEADIERIRLLRMAATGGRSIAQLSDLTNDELSKFIGPVPTGDSGREDASPAAHCEACLGAVMNLDARALDLTLNRAAVNLSRIALTEQVAAPLMQRIGDLWSEGSLKVAHEHMASAAIRSFLGDILRSSEPPEGASGMVVTTPAGELHELGALMIAVLAATIGWDAFYLGPNLTSEEIAAAVDRVEARVVALSIVFLGDGVSLVRELNKLRRSLPNGLSIVVGGRAADAYRETLEVINAVRLNDLPGFRRELESFDIRETV